MTVEEALEFFDSQPRIKNKLKTLYDVGLGYIKLGQSATTLSGGEAQGQAVNGAFKAPHGQNPLYSGRADHGTAHRRCAQADVLQTLCDSGNTIVVIEHNLDVIKTADHIIDLGPGGGNNGGTIVATGTPEQVAENPNSFTGEFLKKVLKK